MLTVVTDSTVMLTRREAAELGVVVMPMSYSLDGVVHREGFMGENSDYGFALAAATLRETMPFYPSECTRTIRSCLERGEDVLCVTMSSRLSGAFRSAVAAADEVRRAYDERLPAHLAVLDSWGTAPGLELVVRHARLLADAGVGFDDMLVALRAYRGRTGISFAVPDMAALRRSGRLGATRRSVTAQLDRYPVFCLRQGAIETVEVARGTVRMARALSRLVPVEVRTLYVSCFGPPGPAARQLLLELRRSHPRAKVLVKDGGPVLSCHLGLGTVALCWGPVGEGEAWG